jgi:hypothetical protein
MNKKGLHGSPFLLLVCGRCIIAATQSDCITCGLGKMDVERLSHRHFEFYRHSELVSESPGMDNECPEMLK